MFRNTIALLFLSVSLFGQCVPTLNPFTGLLDCIGSGGSAPSGGAVGGASAVAAAQVLFGASAGVATSEAAFTYTAATDLLVIGTQTGSANASARLIVVGDSNAYGMVFKTSGSATNMYVGMDTSAVGLNFSSNAGTNLMRLVNGTGNILIGSGMTNDRGYRLLVGNSGSAGTLSVVDPTATVGATRVDFGWDGTNTSTLTTQMFIRAGAIQSTNFLTTWQNNLGTTIAGVNASGQVRGTDFYNIGDKFFQQSNVIDMSSDFQLRFSSTSAQSGSKDILVFRQAPGVLQIATSGTTGGGLLIEALKSSTGVRYVCVDTTGRITSQASACVGT